MKGSLYRKRYFLFHHPEMSNFLNTLSGDLYRSMKCKLKFSQGEYSIFLTDQFRKQELSEYMSSYYGDVEIVTVSGTIRKCKTIMLSFNQKGKENLTSLR
ncbi:MAG: hypothetical protein ACYCT2_00050 [Thermoplasmataceae archaeon]